MTVPLAVLSVLAAFMVGIFNSAILLLDNAGVIIEMHGI